ncbi:MAG: WD40/YVTN/BNR-like repeat-containing protein, partial [Mycobacteriales bacterium]
HDRRRTDLATRCPPRNRHPTDTARCQLLVRDAWAAGVDERYRVVLGHRSRMRGRSHRGDFGWRTPMATSLTTPESPFEIATTGTDIAWVSEGRCDIGDACDANRLLRTTDGGRTWTATPTSMPVRAVNAVSATMAWAIHDVTLSPARMELVRTTDGGRSWRSAGDPCSATNGHNPWLSGAAFPSASRGWVTCVGQPEQAVQSKAVLQTSDSGKTWTVVARSCPRLGTGSAHPARGGSLSCDGNNPTLTMRADGTGWLWGNRGGLNATSTFGHAWTPIATQVVRPDTTSAVGASLVSDKTGYLIVSGGFGRKLEVTYDGGRSWRALRSWPLAPWLTG